MTVLSVNVNKVAWLRNAREGGSPDLGWAARTIIAAGARGITVHPRPDQRHIRPADVEALTVLLADHPDIEFNIEGNPFAGPRDNGYPGFPRQGRPTARGGWTFLAGGGRIPQDQGRGGFSHAWRHVGAFRAADRNGPA